MSEYSNSSASVKPFVGNPVALFKKKHPIKQQGPAVSINPAHAGDPNDPTTPFDLQSLLEFKAERQREADRPWVRFPQAIKDAVEFLWYEIDGQKSISQIVAWTFERGLKTLMDSEDYGQIAETRKALVWEMKKRRLVPDRWDYEPPGIRYRLSAMKPSASDHLTRTAEILGTYQSVLGGIAVASGIAQAPMEDETREIIQEFLENWRSRLRDRKKAFERAQKRAIREITNKS